MLVVILLPYPRHPLLSLALLVGAQVRMLAEQGFLNQHFPNWTELPFEYNVSAKKSIALLSHYLRRMVIPGECSASAMTQRRPAPTPLASAGPS